MIISRSNWLRVFKFETIGMTTLISTRCYIILNIKNVRINKISIFLKDVQRNSVFLRSVWLFKF